MQSTAKTLGCASAVDLAAKARPRTLTRHQIAARASGEARVAHARVSGHTVTVAVAVAGQARKEREIGHASELDVVRALRAVLRKRHTRARGAIGRHLETRGATPDARTHTHGAWGGEVEVFVDDNDARRSHADADGARCCEAVRARR